MGNISFENVNITDGFWKKKQDLNKNVTVYAVRDRFKDTGRFEAFEFTWKDDALSKVTEGKKNRRPHIFWDSDIAKWIEGAANIIAKGDDIGLQEDIEHIIDCIQENQDENGYFNIYFTVCEPEQRFKRRDDHELYCAGHLIEAAVAYYNATGKDRFLKLMCKYADHIEQVFVTEDSAEFTTPGHEEIELALVKLYHCTGEKRYLELSKFFIDKRGNNKKEENVKPYAHSHASYNQSHRPVRNQTTAEGHCVRAGYLYSGMADIAKEYNDDKLLEACKTIFDNIINKRMYITGGLGQSHLGEAFTIDYDLPNMFAYAETCAAISLVYFAHRMQNLEVDSKYADIIELALYNGFLSGLSLDGKSFFYENPLEIDPYLIGKDVSVPENHRQRFPITQRVEVFGCSCCPPNVIRLIASIGDYIYSNDDDGTYYIHQFADSELNKDDVKIKQTTKYPVDGKITINVSGVNTLAIRIPGWCGDDFIIEGVGFQMKNGYIYIENPPEELKVEFIMKPKLIQSSPYVRENAGRVALKMGPLVYCMEQVDNGRYLRNIKVARELSETVEYDDSLGANVITVNANRPIPSDKLYSDYNPNKEFKRVKFIPYYAFANRGESEMLVWVDVQ